MVFLSGIIINKFGYKTLHIIALAIILVIMAIIFFNFKETLERKEQKKMQRY
ncbi:hypothetical protein [Clostridium sartagoforme]|uniref:hypothetical protein n=1 Tax=Clostridium sartagoforme TaxID=84031 RepID=UPI003BF9533A